MSGHTDNTITIKAPMDLVWDMTNDIDQWPTLFSEYESTEILDRTNERILFQLTMKPDNEGQRWSWVSHRSPDSTAKTVQSHRVETGPFKYMSLFWEYVPVGDSVSMRWVQDFEMKPEAPVTDQAMTDHLNRSTAVQMALIRDAVESATR